MRFGGLVLAIVLATYGLTACGDDGATVDAPTGSETPVDAAIDAPIDAPLPPMKLSDTGLCTDLPCTTINPSAREYGVQFELYADGSTKRRWISIPMGTQIDTSDMNHWKFPVGTKLWKEFSRGGIRVETRYITKLLADDSMPGSWFYASFEWNSAQTDTTLASPGSGVPNANGTQHDIPSRANCRRCHEQVPGRVLGFAAIQIDYSGSVGSIDLADVIALNFLSAPPTAPSAGPYFPFPAAATAVDRAAYGYLHGNCGGCHNPTSTVYSGLTSNIDLRLDVTKLGTVAMIPARATTIGKNGTVGGLTGPIINTNMPANSVMLTRMNSTVFPTKMPEIGTETPDPVGIDAITAWMNQPP